MPSAFGGWHSPRAGLNFLMAAPLWFFEGVEDSVYFIERGLPIGKHDSRLMVTLVSAASSQKV